MIGSELIAAGLWRTVTVTLRRECTYGSLKLFWNKHFPKVIKRCSVVRSIRTMNFIDLRYTVHLLTPLRVRSQLHLCVLSTGGSVAVV